MRKNLFVFLAFLTSWGCAGQGKSQSSTDSFKHEFGINGTKLLSNLFSLSNDAVSTLYVGTYRYKPSKNIGLRTFLGGNLQSSGTNNAIESSNYNVHGKLGIEYINEINSRINFNFGLDFLAGTTKSKSTTLNNANQVFLLDIDNSYIGAGPVARVEFKITDRITLMTESSLYTTFSSRKRLEQIGSQININDSNTSRNINLTEPTSLYVSFKF